MAEIRTIRASDWDAEVLQQTGPVLVDFYAEWCAPCRFVAPLLERFAEAHAGEVVVLKVDTDRDEPLAERYGVRTIPTIVAFFEGREIARAVYPKTLADLEALVAPARRGRV